MPTAPGDPMSPGSGFPTSPTNFLMAAASMANEGSLGAGTAMPSSASPPARSAPVPRGQNLQTGWTPRRLGRRGLRVVR